MTETNELCNEKFKVINHRIEDLETEVKDIKALTIAINTVNSKVDTLTDNVTESKGGLKEITKRPAERWEKLFMAIVCAVGAGIVGIVLALIFK